MYLYYLFMLNFYINLSKFMCDIYYDIDGSRDKRREPVKLASTRTGTSYQVPYSITAICCARQHEFVVV